MARRSDKRGFASMDLERRRRIASEGGRSSHGGRNRDYEEDDYDREYEDYDEDEDQNVSNRYNEDEDYDEDDDYENTGYEDEGEYEENDYGSRRGRRRSSSGRGRSYSGRGFASWDPEDRRRVTSRGGHARWEDD